MSLFPLGHLTDEQRQQLWEEAKLTEHFADPNVRSLIEDWRRHQFLYATQDSSAWLYVAERHKAAADVLYDAYKAAEKRRTDAAHLRVADFRKRHPLGGTETRPLTSQEYRDRIEILFEYDYYLLAGYALENCLKGCLVALSPPSGAGNKLDKRLIGHKLIDLAQACNLVVSDDEREILGVLSRNVVWGKYPAPLDLGDMPLDGEYPSANHLEPSTLRVRLAARSLIDSLYGRVVAESNKIGRPAV